MNLLLLSMAFGLIALRDLIPLIKKKDTRGIVIHASLVLAGYSLSLIQVLEIGIPTPTNLIKLVVKAFIQVNFSYSS